MATSPAKQAGIAHLMLAVALLVAIGGGGQPVADADRIEAEYSAVFRRIEAAFDKATAAD